MNRRNSALRFAAVLLTGPCAAVYAGDGGSGNSLGYEFIGQVLNASATQSLQYGYLSSVPGLSSIPTAGGPVSEANALLTFYNDTATQQVINNGPIRVIDRTGTATIYLNASAAVTSQIRTLSVPARQSKPAVCDIKWSSIRQVATSPRHSK